jgi:hypothetical protein
LGLKTEPEARRDRDGIRVRSEASRKRECGLITELVSGEARLRCNEACPSDGDIYNLPILPLRGVYLLLCCMSRIVNHQDYIYRIEVEGYATLGTLVHFLFGRLVISFMWKSR